MVEETVWVKKKYVRPRLSSDELWLIYRLIESALEYVCSHKDALLFRKRK
jgi:hypothetical protein